MTAVLCREWSVVVNRLLVGRMIAKQEFLKAKRVRLAGKEIDWHTRPTASRQQPRLFMLMRWIATRELLFTRSHLPTR